MSKVMVLAILAALAYFLRAKAAKLKALLPVRETEDEA